MSGFITSVLAFLVAIAILVAVHEWGHYIVARLVGVKVLRYSIGFGRPLWLRRWGPDQTEYCISAIPFGGYVRLLDERDGEVDPDELPRAFNRQSVPSRIAILFAGPALNFVFAVLAYWAMFVSGVPGLKPVVGEVEPESMAAVAGLEQNDQLIAVGDRPVATWDAAVIALLDELLANGDLRLEVRGLAGDRRLIVLPTAQRVAELTEPGALFKGTGIRPWAPVIEPVFDEILPGGAAEAAGFKSGDRIRSADGVAISNWSQWVELVRAKPAETLTVEVQRDDATLPITLRVGELTDESGATVGRIGASVKVPPDLYAEMRATQRFAPAAAFGAAVEKTWDMAALTVRMIGRMLTGDVSVKNISGPINIAQYAGYSASGGLSSFIGFLAIVSISLGILNLLPVPMLDGGQIVYQLAEGIKGSPMSERAQLIGQQMGILLLIMLMSFAFYNDISRILG
jgi:regulator of sigma E protease